MYKMSIFSHGGFVSSQETKSALLFFFFIRRHLKMCCSFTAVLWLLRDNTVHPGHWQLQKWIIGNCCQARDPPWVYLSLFPRLSLRSVKFFIIYILTLPEGHRPIKRPSWGVSCGLHFYESSRRVFTGSAWLHVPDSPHSYRAAYKGMLINGINNILLRDGVITKLSVREQTIFFRKYYRRPGRESVYE